MPYGIAVFQSDQEYRECLKTYKSLCERFERHIAKVSDRLEEEVKFSKEKINPRELASKQDELETPLPGDKHVYCGVCSMNYSDYRFHISSHQHRASVASDDLYDDIDLLIDEFDMEFKQKRDNLTTAAPTQENRQIVKLKRF